MGEAIVSGIAPRRWLIGDAASAAGAAIRGPDGCSHGGCLQRVAAHLAVRHAGVRP